MLQLYIIIYLSNRKTINGGTSIYDWKEDIYIFNCCHQIKISKNINCSMKF